MLSKSVRSFLIIYILCRPTCNFKTHFNLCILFSQTDPVTNFTVKVYKVYLLLATKKEIQTEQNSGLNPFVCILITIFNMTQ